MAKHLTLLQWQTFEGQGWLYIFIIFNNTLNNMPLWSIVMFDHDDLLNVWYNISKEWSVDIRRVILYSFDYTSDNTWLFY